MKSAYSTLVAAILLICTPAQGKSADEVLGKIEKSFSNWDVRVNSNPMTDKKICTAVPRDNPQVQGSANMLAISFRGKGGVKGYEYRLDDHPVSPMKTATSLERDMSVIIFEGNDFEQILNSKRLRIQVVPVLQGLHFEDVNTNGFRASIQYIRDYCK